MKRRARIGLMPLYLELYDRTDPEKRKAFSPFLDQIVSAFEQGGVDVTRVDICCVRREFEQALARLEEADVDLLVTLHLAYSPSLESASVLAASKRPILMLDTTMDPSFGFDVSPERIMYNHGIHGVMDLASVLRREGRSFRIVAGHPANPTMMARALQAARAAYAARVLRETRALRIGASFTGMGDFAVDDAALHESLGPVVEQIDIEPLARAAEAVTDEAIREEMEKDRGRFRCKAPDEVHARSVRVGLGLRALLEQGDYTAFSMNFLAFDSAEGGANTVPFLEASKGMERGIGYGGEGDVLTASMVSALQRGFGRTTFTEIFCPDWEGNSIFLSHMDEINPEVSGGQPWVVEKPFAFTPALNPAIITCAPKPGPGVFVNLAPGPNGSFGLVASAVQVLGDGMDPAIGRAVRGWIRPPQGIEAFLEAYSLHGGTHHSALVLGASTEAVAAFADFAGVGCTIL